MSGAPASLRSTIRRPSIRPSFGLANRLGAWDALMFCSIGPGLTVNFVYVVWTAYLYPGIHYPLAILSVFLMLPVAALYWFFSVAMPRSGGEYAYIGRTIHPAIGLMGSFAVTMTIGGAVGLVTDWLVTYGLADGFAAVSLAPNSAWASTVAGFLWSQTGRTFLGTFSMISLFYVYLRGAKWVVRVSWSGVVATLIMLLLAGGVVTLGGGHSGFIARWNAMSGMKYSDVLGFASTHGYVTGFAAMATVMGGLTYVLQNTTGATFSTNIAGEISKIQRSQMLALFGSLIVMMIVWFLGAQIVYWAIGADFNAALNQILHDSPAAYPAILSGREPMLTLMLGFFTADPILLVCFGLLMAWTLFAALTSLGFAMTRNIFAWSFDRIIPPKFSELDSRYGSPWLTILTYAIVSEVFLLVEIWASEYMAFAGFQIIGWFMAWIFLGVAGIVFPYRCPDTFKRAPSLARSKFFGLPLISLLGAVTLVISLAVEVFMAIPFVEGLADWRGLITVGIIILLPLVIYFISKVSQARSAVPLGMRFIDDR